MLEREIVEHELFQALLEKNVVVEIITDFNDAYTGYYKLRYDAYDKEYSQDTGSPVTAYYKRFNNFKKHFMIRNKEVLTIDVGCSGYNNYERIRVKPTDTVEDFYSRMKEEGRV